MKFRTLHSSALLNKSLNRWLSFQWDSCTYQIHLNRINTRLSVFITNEDILGYLLNFSQEKFLLLTLKKKNISWLPQNTYTEQAERRAAPHHRALQEGSSIMTVGVETRVRRGDERRINKPPGLNLKNNKQLRTVKLDRWNLRLLFHWSSTAWKYFFMGN